MSVSVRRGVVPAVSPEHVHAFRLRCQRLDQRSSEPLGELVRAVGFPATPGGASPYLALRARCPRIDRRLLDRAVFEDGELVDVPFARHTTVLAPLAEAGPLLVASKKSLQEKIEPVAKAGLLDPAREGKLAEALLAALSDGPLAADDLRARLPEPLCVPLGETGRKCGFPSLFTWVLRTLVHQGKVLRIHREKRLDRDGFLYAVPRRPLGPLPPRPAALAHLAGRFFRAYAPAPASAFAFWADATLTEARRAVADAGLASVPAEGSKEPLHLGPEQVEELFAFAPPQPGRLAFVPFRDPSVSACRDLRAMLPEPHRERKLADWRGRLVPAGGGSAVHQHFLLQGGLIIGIWEYDRDAKRVRYATFDSLPGRMKRQVEDLAQDLSGFIASELGHEARFYGDDRGDSFGRLDEVVPSWGLS